MRRYILTAIFAVLVVGLYQVIGIRLVGLGLTKQTRESLFHLKSPPGIDRTVVLYNVGKLEARELGACIDSLLMARPKRIGVNLCHWDKLPADLIQKYKSDSRVVFAGCGSTSQIIGEHNTVTHFRTDRADYFELQLTGFKGRGNAVERINFGSRLNDRLDKRELNSFFAPDDLKGKTILLGYMGDYLTDSIYYFRNCRITPMNDFYGQQNIMPDMYDIEISANIMRTINNEDFIDEINQFVRVLIILAFSLVNVLVLTLIKTRWIIANLSIASILFVVWNGLAGALLIIMIENGYYLQLDELPLILLITTVFTVITNLNEEQSRRTMPG